MPSDALLFLHLLAAFATVTAVVLAATILFSARGADRPGDAAPVARLMGLASWTWNVGGLGVLVFGVWMAIDTDRYDLLDGWIIAAIVLWVIASAAGGRLFAAFRTAPDGPGGLTSVAQATQSVAVWGLLAAATLAMLIDMIFKPGAG